MSRSENGSVLTCNHYTYVKVRDWAVYKFSSPAVSSSSSDHLQSIQRTVYLNEKTVYYIYISQDDRVPLILRKRVCSLARFFKWSVEGKTFTYFNIIRGDCSHAVMFLRYWQSQIHSVIFFFARCHIISHNIAQSRIVCTTRKPISKIH